MLLRLGNDTTLLPEHLLVLKRVLRIVVLGKLPAKQTNLVPRQVEKLVDAFQTATRGFRNAQPDPDRTDDADDAEEVEGSVRGETLVLEEHVRERLVDGVL